MPAFTNLRTIARLLAYRDYRRYFTGNSISLIGTWMQRVTVGWLTWEMTGSGTWLGLIAFADLCPTLLVGLVAGAAADRWPLLRLLRITQGLGFVFAALMAGLHMAGLLNVWLLVLFTFLLAGVAAFAQPARMTLVSAMVPRTDFGPAVAMNSMTFNLARFVGPSCAGVLIATAGVGWAFVANALSFLVFIWQLYRVNPTVQRRSGHDTSMLADIAEGFVYAIRKPGIWAIMLVTITVAFGSRPVIELFAGFASGVFGSDATGLAALTSAVGIGALLGGTWMVGRASGRQLTRGYLSTALGAGSLAVLFTTAPNIYVAVPIAAMLGFCSVSTAIAAQTLMQISTEENMRGRMLSLFGLLQRGMPAIGALAVGSASEVLGLRLAAAIAASGLIASSAILLVFASRIAPKLDGALEEA